MCRIAGYYHKNFRGHYSQENVIVSMRDALTHGGPDDAGYYIDPEATLALGHRRLSILDLSALGHQPYIFEDLVISYNGEVYNYAEIRTQLLSCGYNFQSDSDTEVILKAFHQWGIQCVEKFRGMFAFAIWNTRTHTLYLCRDRVGVKPLYYYFKDGLFLFASELKAFYSHPDFIKSINTNSLQEFFAYGYIKAPASIYENTYKLEPGCWLTLKPDFIPQISRYWDIRTSMDASRNSGNANNPDALVSELKEILLESVSLRMVSDVPVGMFLSGGVDSSLVTALLQTHSAIPLNTFTIGFENSAYDESESARKIAAFLGTRHHAYTCTSKDIEDIIPLLPHMYDEPFGDSSAIPTILVSRFARQHVTVSLSADGGDEQFNGYSIYKDFLTRRDTWNKIRKMSLGAKVPGHVMDSIFRYCSKHSNEKLEKILKWMYRLNASDDLKLYDSYLWHFDPTEIQKLVMNTRLNSDDFFNRKLLLESVSPDLDIYKRMSAYDILSYMCDDILVKVDRATMSVALEGREPLLDHKILEFSAGIPPAINYLDGKGKWPLRKILYDLVPRELIDRPKQGFAVPLTRQYHDIMIQFMDYYLDPVRIQSQGILNAGMVAKLYAGYKSGHPVPENKLWFILCFQMWYETHF